MASMSHPRSSSIIVISSYATICARTLFADNQLAYGHATLRELRRKRPHRSVNEIFNAEEAENGDDEMELDISEDDSGNDDDKKVQLEQIEFSVTFPAMFGTVILDEGHKLKNPETLLHKIISCLDIPVKFFLTATVQPNMPMDFLGYLYLLWQPEWHLSGKSELPSLCPSEVRYTGSLCQPSMGKLSDAVTGSITRNLRGISVRASVS